MVIDAIVDELVRGLLRIDSWSTGYDASDLHVAAASWKEVDLAVLRDGLVATAEREGEPEISCRLPPDLRKILAALELPFKESMPEGTAKELDRLKHQVRGDVFDRMTAGIMELVRLCDTDFWTIDRAALAIQSFFLAQCSEAVFLYSSHSEALGGVELDDVSVFSFGDRGSSRFIGGLARTTNKLVFPIPCWFDVDVHDLRRELDPIRKRLFAPVLIDERRQGGSKQSLVRCIAPQLVNLSLDPHQKEMRNTARRYLADPLRMDLWDRHEEIADPLSGIAGFRTNISGSSIVPRARAAAVRIVRDGVANGSIENTYDLGIEELTEFITSRGLWANDN
jgi:hypothetical protein